MPITQLVGKLLRVLIAQKIMFAWSLGVAFVVLLIPVAPVDASAHDLLQDIFFFNPIDWVLGIGGDIVKDTARGMVEAILALLISLLTFIPATIFFIIAGLVTWIIQTVISIGVIPGATGTPEFVEVGWKLSRDFVNILFILILVFIGLATTLRLEKYQYQKTLPSLIVVALLINFSGVLVGFIVDLSNIVTNFFLSSMGEFGSETFGQIFTTGKNFVSSLDPDTGLFDLFAQGIVYGFVMALFYTISAIVYLLLFLIFFMRMIMLWLLVILAPLAFGAYVLPATRGLWSQWWKQLIQWSIVGIPIGFFMYLSNLILKLNSTEIWGGAPELEGGVSFLAGIIASMLAPITGIVVLFVGITLSMRMAPAGAQKIVNFSKGVPGMAARTRVGAKITAGLATGAQRVLSRESRLVQRPKEWIEKNMPGGEVATGLLRHTAGRAFGGANRAVGGKLIEYAAKKRKTPAPSNFDDMSPAEQEAWVGTQNFASSERIQLTSRMADRKTLRFTSPEFREQATKDRDTLAGNIHYQKDVSDINDAMPETVTKEVLVNMSLAPMVTQTEKDKAQKEVEDKVKKAVTQIQTDAKFDVGLKAELRGKNIEDIAAAKLYTQDIKPQDIAKVVKPKTLSFRLAMRDSNPANLQRIQDNFGKDVLDDVFTGTGGLNAAVPNLDALKGLYKRNQRLVRAFFKTPAFQQFDWAGRDLVEDFGAFEKEMRRTKGGNTNTSQQQRTGRGASTRGARAGSRPSATGAILGRPTKPSARATKPRDDSGASADNQRTTQRVEPPEIPAIKDGMSSVVIGAINNAKRFREKYDRLVREREQATEEDITRLDQDIENERKNIEGEMRAIRPTS